MGKKCLSFQSICICIHIFMENCVKENSKNNFVNYYGAALKHGIWNPETETESRKRNTESTINDRKLKYFTLHNLVQSKENLF